MSSLGYTVIKNETAVHGCNPAISVLVVLVSHKVYFLCSTISLAVLFVIKKIHVLAEIAFCLQLFQLTLSD